MFSKHVHMFIIIIIIIIIIIMCIFIYRTYHLLSHGGLQFLLKGNQINIIEITNLQASFYKSDQIKCWFLVRGENRSTRGKTSHSRVENQQTQSTYDAECGNRTRATLVEDKCSHHNANPATTCSWDEKVYIKNFANIFAFHSKNSEL